ncbi:MAG: hypothetical protein KME27_02900 [Lyngbya sp. HA4199-MV5]|jgi:hypothetical protein|nr:hypothetical protein [Lyngbya sp. HA4199-MV5]
MFRTAVSVLCAVAVLSPTVAFAGDWRDRGSYDRSVYERKSYGRSYDNRRDRERIRVIDFYNRNRDDRNWNSDRRDRRDWDRRDWDRREAERARYWRDRRDDRYRRDYDRDRYNRPSIIIFPRISF